MDQALTLADGAEQQPQISEQIPAAEREWMAAYARLETIRRARASCEGTA